MDPESTLRAAENAVDSRQWDEATEYLAAYSDWRRRLGLEPEDGDNRSKALLKCIPSLYRNHLLAGR